VARAGQQVLRDQDKLGDRISVGVLAKAFPRQAVEEAVDAAGAREQRSRMLPAWLTVYFTLALALFIWSTNWWRTRRALAATVTLDVILILAYTWSLGDSIHLASFTVAPATLHTGDVLRLGLKWETARTLSIRYKVFVHLLDAQGNVIAQRDAEPMADLAPTTTWKSGEVIVDLHGIMLPANVQPQALRIAVGLYNPDNNERLAVRDANGVTLPDGRLLIEGVNAQ